MQLVLPVSFTKHDDFSTFIEGENAHLVSHLQSLLTSSRSHTSANKQAQSLASHQRMTMLHGPAGAGKSHLLLATCELASQVGFSHQYLNLRSMVNMPPQILEGFGKMDVICLDGLESLFNNLDWQVGVFDLINQFIENEGKCMVFAGRESLEQMSFELPDLLTRLKWGTTFKLSALSDEDKLFALAKHAHAQGLTLQDDAIRFLLSRISRDMHKLLDVLQQLDKASLQNKRKLTIPFIKSVLAI